MKQILINEKCNGCGMCVVKCPQYFEENDEGNAKVISGVLAKDNDSALSDVIAQCPTKAISLGESVDKKKSAQDAIAQLRTLAGGIKVTRSDIEFSEGYTVIGTFPYIGSSRYEYSSSSSAERAGLSEFKSRAWSCIDSRILDVITSYRVNVIKPYYSTDERSVYTQFNKKVIDALTAVANLVGRGSLPSDFCNVDVYPERDTAWKMLEKGEIIGENFVGIVRREFNYSPSDYDTYIDWDDTEDYRGKTKYNYNAQGAVDELRRDLQGAVRYAKSDIEENALGYVNGIVNNYNNKIKSLIEQKIRAAEAALNKL